MFSCFLCEHAVEAAVLTGTIDESETENPSLGIASGVVCEHCPLRLYGARYRDLDFEPESALCTVSGPWKAISDIIRGDKEGNIAQETTTFIGELRDVARCITKEINDELYKEVLL